MRDGFVYYFLLRMVRRLPILLLCLGGIIYAILRWKRHPRVSLITMSALVLYLVEAIVFIVFLYVLPELMQPMRLSSAATGWAYSVIFFIEDFVFAVVIILLVAAALSGRGTQTKTHLSAAQTTN